MESDQTERSQIKRNVFLRILFSILWLVPIMLIINVIVGAFVGGMAGAETTSFETGRIAGEEASLEFFQNYGRYVFIVEVIVWAALSILGKLPGTARYKKLKLNR